MLDAVFRFLDAVGIISLRDHDPNKTLHPQPLVWPQLSQRMHAPLRTNIKAPQFVHGSPS